MQTRTQYDGSIVLRTDLVAGAALAAGQILRLNAGKFAPAGASDADAVSVSLEAAAEDAEFLMHFFTPGFVVPMLSAGAFDALVLVYQAAGGKIDDTGTIRRGISLFPATGADQLVDVLLC